MCREILIQIKYIKMVNPKISSIKTRDETDATTSQAKNKKRSQKYSVKKVKRCGRQVARGNKNINKLKNKTNVPYINNANVNPTHSLRHVNKKRLLSNSTFILRSRVVMKVEKTMQRKSNVSSRNQRITAAVVQNEEPLTQQALPCDSENHTQSESPGNIEEPTQEIVTADENSGTSTVGKIFINSLQLIRRFVGLEHK